MQFNDNITSDQPPSYNSLSPQQNANYPLNQQQAGAGPQPTSYQQFSPNSNNNLPV
jgi:hypothetical protein